MNTRICIWALALSALLSGAVFAQGAYNDNVVIVLDSSGSMRKRMGGVSKMDAAKSALKEVLKQVPETTHVGLLVFSAKNLRTDWVYPLGPRDDAKLMAAIDRPMPGGSTPLGRYIKMGADRLLEERAKQFGYGSYRLLIVTDGEADDPAKVNRFAPEIIARGITTDVIGVAMAQDHTLAKVAHSYRRADDPASLKKAVAEVFAEVSTARDSSVTEGAFDELAAIPVEVAAAAIRALSGSGNQPIGATPAVARRSTKSQKAGRPPSPHAPKPPDRDGGGGSTFLIIIVVIVAILNLRKAISQ
jgi:uncharacterized protein YegL